MLIRVRLPAGADFAASLLRRGDPTQNLQLALDSLLLLLKQPQEPRYVTDVVVDLLGDFLELRLHLPEKRLYVVLQVLDPRLQLLLVHQLRF